MSEYNKDSSKYKYQNMIKVDLKDKIFHLLIEGLVIRVVREE